MDVQLFQGDCLEILPRLRGVKIDAVVTDPPYGIRVCNRSDGGVGSISSGSKYYGRMDWDFEPANPQVINWILEQKKPTVIWGGNYYELPPSPCWFVWFKKQTDFTFADAELAWTNSEKAVRVFEYSRGQLVAEGKQHPTQKPVSLMIWAMDRMGIPSGATVIDPYMGGGSTGVACMKTGRNFIGIERNPHYFAIAQKRITAAQSQPTLFGADHA
jgi:DNA modification methylase